MAQRAALTESRLEARPPIHIHIYIHFYIIFNWSFVLDFVQVHVHGRTMRVVELRILKGGC